jgi:phosphoglycolate phosphatase
VLAACGGERLSETAIGGMVGDGAAALVARAFAAAAIPAPPDALARFLAVYEGRLLETTRPYPRVPEVLAALAARRALAVLTNKPLAATRRILDGLDLARFFAPRRVLGGDGPHPRKPAPAALRWLMAEAGVTPSATVLVGDSIVDWRTARAAGVRICLARYGFGFEGVPASALEAGDLVVDEPDGLIDALL